MLRKQEFYATEIWPRWMREVRESGVVFLHGIMGSELYDFDDDDTVWVDLGLWKDVRKLGYESLSPKGALDLDGQLIHARSTVRPPFSPDYYAPYLREIRSGRFCYDWRESIPIEAQRLGVFLDACVAAGQQELSFVTHSMGGCLLLRLLATTERYDQLIKQIVFVAPPFWGALKPLRVLEDGDGVPGDPIVRNSWLRQAASSMPGLFDLLIAPREVWPSRVGDQVITYPIRTDDDIYRPAAWSNRNRWDLREAILTHARNYYRDQRAAVPQVVARLGARISIVTGVNGKTPYAAQRDAGRWVLHGAPAPADPNKLGNGDGVVLFQSSVLADLPPERYWAFQPAARRETHAELCNESAVVDGIKLLLAGKPPVTLAPRDQFFPAIDFTPEAATPPVHEHLDYEERAAARSRVPISRWGDLGLNPDNDAILYHATREAAARVLAGASITSEAERLLKDAEFLRRHVARAVMPILYG